MVAPSRRGAHKTVPFGLYLNAISSLLFRQSQSHSGWPTPRPLPGGGRVGNDYKEGSRISLCLLGEPAYVKTVKIKLLCPPLPRRE